MCDLPAWDGEGFAHYLWRLARHLGNDPGPEPELRARARERGKELTPAVEREPGVEG